MKGAGAFDWCRDMRGVSNDIRMVHFQLSWHGQPLHVLLACVFSQFCGVLIKLQNVVLPVSTLREVGPRLLEWSMMEQHR